MCDISIYTDGAYSREYNLGGYAYIIKYTTGKHKVLKEWSRYNGIKCNKRDYDSTVMELVAVNRAIEDLVGQNKNLKTYSIRLFTDAKYIVDSVNSKSFEIMKHRHFDGKRSKWEWDKLYNYLSSYNIKMIFVHSDFRNKESRKCDTLAKLAIQSLKE